jgi:hypothetical protein
MGEPACKEAGRNAQSQRLRLEDQETEIACIISNATCHDGEKNERALQRECDVADTLLYVRDDLVKRYPNSEDLFNFLLRERSYEDFPTSSSPNFAAARPFGAKKIHEAIQKGLLTPHWHFHFCTTHRNDADGEWHRHMSGQSRNTIFSFADGRGVGARDLEAHKSNVYDLEFTPFFKCAGMSENAFDCLLLQMESKCQGVHHNKVPVGTVGF